MLPWPDVPDAALSSQGISNTDRPAAASCRPLDITSLCRYSPAQGHGPGPSPPEGPGPQNRGPGFCAKNSGSAGAGTNLPWTSRPPRQQSCLSRIGNNPQNLRLGLTSVAWTGRAMSTVPLQGPPGTRSRPLSHCTCTGGKLGCRILQGAPRFAFKATTSATPHPTLRARAWPTLLQPPWLVCPPSRPEAPPAHSNALTSSNWSPCSPKPRLQETQLPSGPLKPGFPLCPSAHSLPPLPRTRLTPSCGQALLLDWGLPS